MLAQNHRVAVIDDEDDGRDTLVDQLVEHNFEGIPIIGPFGGDMPRLLDAIEQANPNFVICDFRLTARQFATFTGLDVVEELIARKRPAMLVTMFQDRERMALRSARPRVPVIKARDRFDIADLPTLHDVVCREIDNNPVSSRKPHRVVLRVEAIRAEDIDIVVPSWNREHAFVLPRRLISQPIRSAVKEGDYLLGSVNIGASHEDELYFDKVDEIVAGIEDLA